MSISATVRRINRWAPVAEDKRAAGLRAVNLGAIALQRDIVKSLAGPRTGAIYEGGRSRPHQASAAMEAPSNDFGKLRQSTIANKAETIDDNAEVVVSADYAIALEYGTRDMAARPFVRPAFARMKDGIILSIRKALGKD